MKTSQKLWTEKKGWESVCGNGIGDKAQIVLVFGGPKILSDKSRLDEIKKFYPGAHLIGCSTAGEIAGSAVYDDSLTATAVLFEKTDVQLAKTTISDMGDTFKAGQDLADKLEHSGLSHVFVLSDGLNINGSALTKGLRSKLPEGVAVTGGLAGDQGQFQNTLVLVDEQASNNTVAVIGFYGNAIRIGHGSKGGWDSFGPDRLVTNSSENILYELDKHPALELYKSYLGEQAQGLPATGLLFPLSITIDDTEERLVRTILAVDEENGSMTFAGDVPQGCYARLMKASMERLVDGAAESARDSLAQGSSSPDLAILISCVGRKIVLKQRVDEEVECVRDILGENATLTGFYSYGEIGPVGPNEKQPELHNQTMTITTFSEE